MSLEYNKNLIPRAKELRKNAMPQENHPWYDFLRSYKPRFQRQKTIGQFIADFYCEKAKLVIELDGSQHFTPEGTHTTKPALPPLLPTAWLCCASPTATSTVSSRLSAQK